ncbi:DUF305 domain-containing protein [Geodermatophilus sp. YIM 151500]|uniref:DUF305 domain-containing protein n=1 Tax=Geodermatophilus sp. YIM 151500 TaxID=2984531 RepID=UPI0021E48ED7|nr:DUF305 domain-containing protein [Geodermatophilus sp. YIM 151500]MCV2488422.1 DUF305 domain-containing protein [Geodermatophilus sp. YIM 151500]
MTNPPIGARSLLAGLVVGLAALTGCGETPPSEATSAGEADVAFAQQMIPHHEGALVMSEMVLERAADPRVRDLAERIEAGQRPEIDLLTGWLTEWGAEPADGGMAMEHGEHRDGAGADPDLLAEADAAAFDRMWLEAMIAHHQGAVEMAEAEVADGRDREAVDLARGIAETQRAEIEEMRQLLADLGG